MVNSIRGAMFFVVLVSSFHVFLFCDVWICYWELIDLF